MDETDLFLEDGDGGEQLLTAPLEQTGLLGHGAEVLADVAAGDEGTDLVERIASRENVQTICNSLLLGVCVVLCSTVIAVPTAFLLARTQLAKHSWLEIVFMIPFMTPPYIASMGWVLFMQKRACFSSCFPQQVRGQRASSASAGLCW